MSKFAKTLGLDVTDKSGDTVAVPADLKAIKTAYTSDSSIATVTPDGKVLGQKAGTVTVTAVVYKANGETQDFTYTVNVKADAPTVATLTANEHATYSASQNVAEMINAKVVDNYGTGYVLNEIASYKDFFGVQYIISNVKGDGTSTGTAILNTDGKIAITGTVKEFVVKAISSNGKTTTTQITN